MKPAKSDRPFSAGKLPSEILHHLLQTHRQQRDDLLVGPDIGIDAAAVRVGDRIVIAKADPITFTADQMGWYAVHVNANDVACMGAEPKWFLAVLLLPERSTTQEVVEHLFRDIANACREVGATLIGGHTEITPGLDRPLIAGFMLGETREAGLLRLSHCEPEDRLVLANGIAIEATAIIAREFADELRDSYDEDFLNRCQNFIFRPGISVLKAAREARRAVQPRAMHDPTEGGLATALHEIADATGYGIEVYEEHIPVLPEAKVLCDQYDLDLLGVISSGALIIVTGPEEAAPLVKHLHSRGIRAAEIGKLVANPERRVLIHGNEESALPRFDQDEIVKLF